MQQGYKNKWAYNIEHYGIVSNYYVPVIGEGIKELKKYAIEI